MTREGYKTRFQNCQHDWELHVDVEDCGGPAVGNGIFRCKNCESYVTMLEKCALDQTVSQEKSLVIQEKHTKIGMIANIISAITLILAFLTLLFGDKILMLLS